MIQKSKAAVIPISIKNADSSPNSARSDWKTALRELITCSDELLDLLEIHDPYIRQKAKLASQLFPVKATHSYVERINKGSINDPLLRQILPLEDEFVQNQAFTNDPTGDEAASQSPGLLHKYHGRVLLVLTSLCAINCRYCFRRAYPYSEQQANRKQWRSIHEYIARDTSIEEVILSGGDPLTFDNNKLADLLEMISSIKHIKRIRIHSRLPIVLPERIDEALTQLLKQQRCQMIMVVHSNHANEISDSVQSALERLKHAGVTLFNQAVLLKGVNDSLESQQKLHETLFNFGVIPYYLHKLDKVTGTTHFSIDDKHISELYKQMQNTLPGYLVPKLVEDLPNQTSKTLRF